MAVVVFVFVFTTRKHKKNKAKFENNACTVSNPLFKKKQSDQTNDNDDNPVIFKQLCNLQFILIFLANADAAGCPYH